jgi:dTMP kinase
MKYIVDMNAQTKLRGLIVVEGIDGVGKTSIGRCLAANLNATFVHTPNEIYNSLRNVLDGRSSIDSLLFYLSSVAYEIENWISGDNKLLVMDRYWISSLSYYFMKSEEFNNVSIFEQIEKFFCWIKNIFPEPSIIINLVCNRDVRLARLNERVSNGFGDNISMEYELRYHTLLNKTISLSSAAKIDFDTSEYSANESAAILHKKVMSLLIKHSKPKIIFLHGAPASGKTTFANLIIKQLSMYPIKICHIDDKIELINLCETIGIEGLDFHRNENMQIGNISDTILKERAIHFGNVMKQHSIFADLIIAEYSSLNYKDDFMNMQLAYPNILANELTILLTVPKDLSLQRNQNRGDGSGAKRAVPSDYIEKYYSLQLQNEASLNVDIHVSDDKENALRNILCWVLKNE